MNDTHEWRFDECSEGWTLIVTPEVSWRDLIPHTKAQWILLVLMGFWWIPFLVRVLKAPFEMITSGNGDVGSAVAILLSFVISYFWLSWIVPFPLFGQAHRLRKPIVIRFNGDSFETADGLFKAHMLESLRLDSRGALGNHVRVVFTSNSMKNAELVGFPGVRCHSGEKLIAAIKGRVGAA